jgi:hypothetical protein
MTDRARVRYPRHSLPMTSFGKPPHIFLKPVTRPNPAQAYHQAGWRLRHSTSLFKRRAFFRKRAYGQKRLHMQPSMTPHSSILQHAAVRAYSRANHCFADVGDLELNQPISRNAMRGSSVGQDAREASPRLLGLEEDEQYSTSISP